MLKKTKKVVALVMVTVGFSGIILIGRSTTKLSAKETEATVETETSVEPPTLPKASPMEQKVASQVALTTRIDQLKVEGWKENLLNEPAYLKLADNNKLRYYFGSKDDIGQDANGIANGKPVSQGTNQIKLPNLDFIDVDDQGKETIIPHVYLHDSGYPAGIFSSQGLIVATKTGSTRSSSIMYNPASDFKIFEKTINGFTAKKLIYIASYHDAKYNPELLVETTMTGLPIGRVKTDQEVTNISGQTYSQFMLGYSEDTKLGPADNVPAIALGQNRGFYIRYEKDPQHAYRLTYYVTDKDYAGLKQADNWRGGFWTKYYDYRAPNSKEFWGGWGGEETFFCFNGKGYNPPSMEYYDYGAFTDITATGDENKNWPQDYQITKDFDSAISYKNQPITFAPDQKTGFSWMLGIDAESDGPEISLNDTSLSVNQGAQASISGQWRDIASQKVNLYYELNGAPRKAVAENIANTTMNKWEDFEFKLNAADMKIGENKLTVYIINQEDQQSTVATMTIDVKSKVAIRYEDESGAAITPPLSANAPIELTGKVTDTFQFPIPDLTPEYQFVKAEGATISADQVNGTFGAANTQVKLIYKAIPKEVTMTVRYVLKGTTIPLKDLSNNNAAIANVTEKVTIDKPISDYTAKYQKIITGYRFDSVLDGTGTVPNTNFTVTLQYEGQLSLEKVPAEINFGTTSLTLSSSTIYPEADTSVEIIDTMENSDNWNLQLRVKDGFKTKNDTLFKGAVKFKTLDDTDIALNNNSQTIALKKGHTVGRDTITWNKDKTGLYLIQAPGNLSDTYEGTLEWTLTDGK